MVARALRLIRQNGAHALVAVLLLSALWPVPVQAQQPKAGEVTTIHGVATVARPALPQELPLKFKDDVFYKDRIATKESSIVRVLLGGKALITVRELSVLTITEEPGRATVDLKSGKIALAVARKLMRPGETIEIRTPTAVASVRGTVVIAEIIGSLVLLSVPSGSMTVTMPQLPGAPSQTVQQGQTLPVTAAGFGTVTPISPQIYTGVTTSTVGGGGGSPPPPPPQVVQNQVEQISLIFGGPPPVAPPPPPPPPPRTDPCQTNPAACAPPPPPTADLSVSKIASSNPVVGGNLTYTVVVTNNGPDTATGVTLTDPLPTGTTFASATPTQGSCSGTGTVTCSLGSLANGAKATVTIVVQPTASGNVSNTANVSDQQTDPQANNTATVVATASVAAGAPPPPVVEPCQTNPAACAPPPPPTADLSVTKTASTTTSKSGNTITYTVTVTNSGPDTATGVTLTDTLPAGVTLVSAPAGCSGTSTVTCTIGSLSSGGTATVTIVVSTTTAGSITNTASVTGGQTDPTTTNNAGMASSTVPAVPPLFPVVIANNGATRSNITLANGVSLGTFFSTDPGTPSLISPLDNISGRTINNPLMGPLLTASVPRPTDAEFAKFGPSVILIRGADGAPVNVFELTNSDLTSSSAPLFSVTGPRLLVDINTLLAMDPSTLTLGGSLLSLSSATLTSTGPLFSAAGDSGGRSSITQTGSSGAPLIDVSSGDVSSGTLTVTGAGQSVLSLNKSDLVVTGPILQMTGSSNVTVGPDGSRGPVLQLANTSTATTSVDSAFKISGGSLTASTLVSGDATSTLTLNGSLLDLSGGSINVSKVFDLKDTVTFKLTTHQPVINMSSSHLTLGPGQELLSFGVDTGDQIEQNGVALIATGTASAPSTISLQGRLLDLGGVKLTDSQAQIQLSHTTVTQTGSDPLIDVLGQPVTMAGPMLYVGGGSPITGSTITTGGPVFHFGPGSFTSNTTDELVETGAGDTIKSSSNFLRLTDGASVRLKGTFLNASGSTLCSGSTSCATGAPGNTAFMVVTGGAHLTQTGIPGPRLIVLSGGSVTAGGNFLNVTGTGSEVNLGAGTLLSSNGTTITAGNNLVRIRDGGALSSSATDHLLLFTGGSYIGGGTLNTASGGSLLRMFSQVDHPGTSLTLTSPYLGSSGRTTFFSNDASLFNITDGASINAAGDFALFGTGSATSAFSIFRLDTNTSFTQPGQPTTVGSGASATVNINGTLIGGANFTFTTQNGGDFLFLHNQVTLNQTNTTKALVALDGTGLAAGAFAINAAGRFLSMSADSPPPALNLSGSLLSALNAKITTAGDFAALSDGATLTGASDDPLVSLSGTTVTAGTAGTDTHFLKVAGSSSRVSLTGQGGFLSATGGSLTVMGEDFIEVRDGGRLEMTKPGADPLVQLTNGAALNLNQASLVSVSSTGAVAVTGDVLNVTETGTVSNTTGAAPVLSVGAGGTLTATGVFLNKSGTGTLTLNSALLDLGGGSTGTGDTALLQVAGGTVNDSATLVNVSGTSTLNRPLLAVSGSGSVGSADTPVASLLTLGADLTLNKSLLVQSGGSVTTSNDALSVGGNTLTLTASEMTPVFDLRGGTLTLQKGLVNVTSTGHIDADLLAATAPLLNLLNVTTTTSARDLLNLVGQSSITRSSSVVPSEALIKLDNSRLAVGCSSGCPSAALVSLGGGTSLTWNGDLIRLTNGSTITISNGPLLSVGGNPGLSISGALVAYGSGTNRISITNTLCPCTPIGGIPVAISGGASVSITNPIRNLGLGGTFNFVLSNNTLSRGGTAVIDARGNVTISGPN